MRNIARISIGKLVSETHATHTARFKQQIYLFVCVCESFSAFDLTPGPYDLWVCRVCPPLGIWWYPSGAEVWTTCQHAIIDIDRNPVDLSNQRILKEYCKRWEIVTCCKSPPLELCYYKQYWKPSDGHHIKVIRRTPWCTEMPWSMQYFSNTHHTLLHTSQFQFPEHTFRLLACCYDAKR